MAMISNYYAQVGVDIKRGSIQQVDRYLNEIQKRFQAFRTRLNKTGTFRVAASLDRNRTINNMRRDLASVGKGVRINLDNVRISRNAISKSIQQSLGGPGGALTLNARISRDSLNAMRRQLTEEMQNITLSPRINPRVSRGTFGSSVAGAAMGASAGRTWAGDKTTRMSPTSGRRFNPWYNPMMIGGGLGAFLRYGPYSLPFIAGSMGLSSLAGRATDIQSAQRVLGVASGGSLAGGQNMQFLSRLGEELGFTAVGVAPQYSRLLTAAQGTSLEGGMQSHYTDLMRYAAVRGADPESITSMFRRIISRRRIRVGDMDQLESSGMSNIYQLLADAVSGGDTNKLREQLKGSGLDTEDALPKLFRAAGRDAEKFLKDYYGSLERYRGRSAEKTSQWWQRMMQGGVEEAMTDFYKVWAQIMGEGTGAETLGNVIGRVVHLFNAALLGATEFYDYLRGEEKEGNFMESIFGPSSENERLQNILSSMRQIGNYITDIFSNSGDILSLMHDVFLEIKPILDHIWDATYSIAMLLTGGSAGAHYAERHLSASRRIRSEVESEMPDASEAQRMRVSRERISAWRKANPYEGGSLRDEVKGLLNPFSLGDMSGYNKGAVEVNRGYVESITRGEIDPPKGSPWVDKLPSWLTNFLRNEASSLAGSTGMSGPPGSPRLPPDLVRSYRGGVDLSGISLRDRNFPGVSSVAGGNRNVNVDINVSGSIGIEGGEFSTLFLEDTLSGAIIQHILGPADTQNQENDYR